MSLALAFVVALGVAEPSLPTRQSSPLADLVQTACVDTGMRREAVEHTARANRWSTTRITRQTGQQGWILAYRVDEATIVVSGVPLGGEVDPSLASLCMVSTSVLQPDWLLGVERLAHDLGLAAAAVGDIPGPAEMHIWSKLGGLTLTSAYQPSNRNVAVTLSRQIVTSSQ